MLDTDALVENEAAAMPTLGHGLIASRLQRALGDFVEEHGLGLVFSARTSFRVGTEPKDPDLAYVSKGRLSGLPADLDVDADFAPDLVVEIASRSDTLATISRKVRAYLDVGVGAVWVVNPWLRTVEVFRADGHHALLSESDALRGDPVVPGFSVDLRASSPRKARPVRTNVTSVVQGARDRVAHGKIHEHVEPYSAAWICRTRSA